MGIDGFSMSNLGLNRNLTSAQMANEAEATANQALENQIADVDGIGKKEKAGRKDPDANQGEQIVLSQDDEDNEDGSQYHFKMNSEGMIEVWDSVTNSIAKTISPEDAANTLMNLSKIPGIFVNKEV